LGIRMRNVTISEREVIYDCVDVCMYVCESKIKKKAKKIKKKSALQSYWLQVACVPLHE